MRVVLKVYLGYSVRSQLFTYKLDDSRYERKTGFNLFLFLE